MTMRDFNFSPNGCHSRESGYVLKPSVFRRLIQYLLYVETILIVSNGDLRYYNYIQILKLNKSFEKLSEYCINLKYAIIISWKIKYIKSIKK